MFRIGIIEYRLFSPSFLNSKNINFHKLLTSQQDKAQACLNEKIDLMIDDSIDTCESVKASGVRTLVFTSDLNKDKETTCDRVGSWVELYNYIHKNLPIKKD